MIEQNAQQQPPLFLSVRKVAASLNTFDDQQDVADTDCIDALNVVFDRGYPTPRAGSSLAYLKPVGETNPLLNLFSLKTSDSVEYTVAVYGPNFYLLDTVNSNAQASAWIQLNGSYTPASTSLFYGYANWTAGRGSDVLYCGNGMDDTIKWQMGLAHTTAATLITDTTIALDSSTRFPATGDIVIQSGSTKTVASYTSNSANVLTLSEAIGTVFPIGTLVAFQIQDMNMMPKGKIFTKYQQRLIISNSLGYETTMWYSNVGTPEDFSVLNTPAGGGFDIFYEGNGQITGVLDFGIYLAILKEDSFFRFEFVIDSTNSTKIDQITPLISDKSMGAKYPTGWLMKNRTLYYVTSTEGIFSIAPVITGFQTTINLQVLSQKIQPTVLGLSFSNTKCSSLFQKLFFTCATQDTNDTVLVYDTLRQYWTKFNNWAVQDWLTTNNNLYFGSSQDGNIYLAFDPNYTDSQTPYSSYVTTRRFDFGAPSMPKTMSKIYVQGYITTNTTLYVDVIYNEDGALQKLTYPIIGNNPTAVQPIPKALAMVMFGLPIFGDEDLQGFSGIGVFRVYLNVPIKYGFYNVQLKFYTNTLESNWSVTGVGFNARVESMAPSQLSIDTSGTLGVAAVGGIPVSSISIGSQTGSSPVTSVFGRIGAVVATTGDYTTASVPDSTDKRYVTDAELTVLGNTSGTNTGDQTNISGNAATATFATSAGSATTAGFATSAGTAATVTTNANLTGPVTSTGNATSIANGAITNAMLANSAVANLSGTNTGDQTNISGNAATVTTNANLTGVVTSTGNATAIANGAITNAMLANSAVASLSGTNTGDQTNISGNAATVTTNANLTGPITSSGNTTSVGSQTGTGSKFVMDTSPTLITPNLGVATSTVIIQTANAITASSNAATIPVTSGHNIVTNNSAATLTITLTTSGAVNMQMVVVQILDSSAVAQTITWVNTENSDQTVPSTSNGSTTLPRTAGFIYNSATTKWRCIANS